MNFQQAIDQLKIPANWMTAPKDKITVNVPEPLNQRIDELSKELDVTKSLLLLLGFAFLLKLLSDWEK